MDLPHERSDLDKATETWFSHIGYPTRAQALSEAMQWYRCCKGANVKPCAVGIRLLVLKKARIGFKARDFRLINDANIVHCISIPMDSGGACPLASPLP